jgi:hypothetical protein
LAIDDSRDIAAPLLAQESLTKTSPANAAINLPVNAVVLSWEPQELPDNVVFQYCLRTNKASCPGPKWVRVGKVTSITLRNLPHDLSDAILVEKPFSVPLLVEIVQRLATG